MTDKDKYKDSDPPSKAKAPAQGSAVAILDYTATKVAILETTARLAELNAHKADLEAAYDAGMHWKDLPSFKSDEGIDVAQLSANRIINVDTDTKKAKALAVHVGGKTFVHKEDGPDGHWVYRLAA